MGWVNLSGVVIPTGAVWHRGLRYPDWLVNATEPYTVDVITFGGLLVPSAAVRDIGVPRSDFFMMWEEYEFCLRLRGAGWKILVLPRPLVDIDGLPPGSRSAPWRAYYDARNSWITVRDFAGWDTRLWWLVRQIKFCLGTLPAPDRWSRLRFRTRGMLHGWRGTTGTTVIP